MITNQQLVVKTHELNGKNELNGLYVVLRCFFPH